MSLLRWTSHKRTNMELNGRVAKANMSLDKCIHAVRGNYWKTMKTLKFLMLSLMAFASIGQAFAACDTPSDRAADGSRCGGRASSERPGGK